MIITGGVKENIMATTKSSRNKTIDTPLSEGQVYLERCIAVTQKQADLNQVLDKTIIGNMLDVCSLLPAQSVDLIIADPPYNLTKSFNGTTFAKKKMLIMRNIPVDG